MDMQNVSNLQIPEGEVKTIHNRDGRLLWGGLGYDTKYAGDTTQATYTGKNLASPQSVFVKNNPYSEMVFSKSVFIPAGTYSASISNVINATNWRFAFKFFYTDGTNVLDAITQGVVTFSIDAIGDSYNNNTACVQRNNGTLTSLYFTTTVDTYVVFGIMFGDVSNSTTLNYQLEVGQTSSTYEPYTGGAPSPSPNYPQPVNVVTGTQSVRVDDGVLSRSYGLGLGSIELCKIGDYQDYIYKSGDDWYVHKEIMRIVYDGEGETWSKAGDGSMRMALSPDAVRGSSSNNPIMSNQYVSRFSTSINNSIFLSGGQSQLGIADNVNAVDYQTWKSWLNSNNLIVYYALGTPTDAKITDTALIAQLDSVHQWLTRYGYESTVSGNLPIIIDRANL